MLYNPALPQSAPVRLSLPAGVALLGLFGLAPVFVVNAWPLAALPALWLILWRPAVPPRGIWLPAALAGLAALAAPSPALAIGYLWLLLFLVLTVGSFQALPAGAAYDALIIGGALFALVGPIDWMGGRMVGLLGNPNLAGSLLAICLALALARRRWLPAVIIGAGLLATKSIGSLMGAEAGIIFLALQSARSRQMIRQRSYLPILLALVTGAALLITRGDRLWWASLRPLQWGTGIAMAYHAPLLGMGSGAFPDVWAGVMSDPTRAFTHAHCFYIQVLAESGIVGALALAALVVWIAYHVRGPALVGLIVLGVHGLVDATALHPVIAWLAAALIGIGSAQEMKPTRLAIILAGALLVLSPLAAGIVQLHY